MSRKPRSCKTYEEGFDTAVRLDEIKRPLKRLKKLKKLKELDEPKELKELKKLEAEYKKATHRITPAARAAAYPRHRIIIKAAQQQLARTGKINVAQLTRDLTAQGQLRRKYAKSGNRELQDVEQSKEGAVRAVLKKAKFI